MPPAKEGGETSGSKTDNTRAYFRKNKALTLEGYEPNTHYRHQVAGFYQAGRVLEGILRSLNNLLERFHQSYFFYLLPNNDRFVSIGLYMPAVCLIGSPLLIRALIMWLDIYSQLKPKKSEITEEEKDCRDGRKEKKKIGKNNSKVQFVNIGLVLLVSHMMGWLFVQSGIWLSKIGHEFFGFESQISLYIGYFNYFILSLTIPCVFKLSTIECVLVNIIALLETVTVFLTIAMHNFSLSLILCTIYVPVFVTTATNIKRIRDAFWSIFMFVIHPFILIHIMVLAYTWATQGQEELLTKAWTATRDALLYFNVDNLIYGNWFLEAVFGFLISNWILYWTLLRSARVRN